jgi:serine/threonine-protein kinase RsbW
VLAEFAWQVSRLAQVRSRLSTGSLLRKGRCGLQNGCKRRRQAVEVEQDNVSGGTLKGGQFMSLLHPRGRRGSIRNSVMSNAVIPSTTDGVASFVERLLRMLANYRFENDEVFEIRLAVEEALANAITHGNKLDPAKEVHITFCMQPAEFSIRIADEGQGFDPGAVPDPTDAEHLDKPGGRGLLLMRHFMDAVRFNAKANVVTLLRRRRAAARRDRTQQAHTIAQDAAAPNVGARSTICGSQLDWAIALIPNLRPKAGLVLLLASFLVLSCAGWHDVYEDLVEGASFQRWRSSLGTAISGMSLAVFAVYELATGYRSVETMH